jgi:ankyrin repeat protein
MVLSLVPRLCRGMHVGKLRLLREGLEGARSRRMITNGRIRISGIRDSSPENPGAPRNPGPPSRMKRGFFMKSGRLFMIANALLVFVVVLAMLPSVGQGEDTDSPRHQKTQAADKGSGLSSEVSKTRASLKIDKTSVLFHVDNIRRGEIVVIRNTSGLDRTLSLELPRVGLIYDQVSRMPEQTRIPRDKREQFVVPPDSGIFIVLIPETDPSSLKMLNGKEIVIQVYEADKVRETFRLPIKVALDSKSRLTLPPKETKAHTEIKKFEKKRRAESPKDQSRSFPRSPLNATDTLDNRLRKAAARGDLRSVKTLLAKGADVNAKNQIGMNALMAAVRGGHLKVVKFLIDKGAKVDARDNDGFTALMTACGLGYLQVANVLLDKGAQVNARTEYGVTALKNAINSQCVPLVELLLARGADVNARLDDGSTLLMWATIPGKIEIVKLLLQSGANVHAKSRDGSTALFWAAVNERPELVKLLNTHGAEVTLSIAAILGDVEEVKRLLEAGGDVNAKDREGWTALMNAAQRGHVAVMRVLLGKGAQIGANRKGRSTALMDAIGSGHMEDIKLLITEGADINKTRIRTNRSARHVYGSRLSPLMHAVAWGQTQLVKLLLQKGVDVNVRYGEMDYSALWLAGKKGDTEVVRLLKAYGATEQTNKDKKE